MIKEQQEVAFLCYWSSAKLPAAEEEKKKKRSSVLHRVQVWDLSWDWIQSSDWFLRPRQRRRYERESDGERVRGGNMRATGINRGVGGLDQQKKQTEERGSLASVQMKYLTIWSLGALNQSQWEREDCSTDWFLCKAELQRAAPRGFKNLILHKDALLDTERRKSCLTQTLIKTSHTICRVDLLFHKG